MEEKKVTIISETHCSVEESDGRNKIIGITREQTIADDL
jgi:hypothetical protein